MTSTTRPLRSGVRHRPAPLAPSKRLFDLVVGGLLALLTLPIMLTLALVSAVRFGAFPFFVQQRIGRNGEEIRCIKIRTLSPLVPPYLDKTELEEHGEEHAAVIRRLHLDELPQFWQVLVGTFSLVGPRPMIESIVDRMAEDVSVIRHSVRPGITGPWQVSVDGSNLIEDTCDYDLAYVRHASPWVDLRILLWTTVQAVGVRKRSKDEVFNLLGVATDEPHAAPLDLHGVDHRAVRGGSTLAEPVVSRQAS